MKVRESDFIRQKKPLLRKLLKTLEEQYPYISILAMDSTAKTYRVSRKNTGIHEDNILSERGFVIRVSDGAHYAEYSFNRISEDLLEEICSGVAEAAAMSQYAVPQKIGENTYAVPEEEKTSFVGSTDYETDPEVLGDGEIIALLSNIKEKGLAVSTKILDCAVMCNYQKYSKLFLSGKKELEQNVMWMTGAISLTASRGEEIKDSFRSFSGLGGAEVLSQMEDAVENCAAVTLELLKSEPMIPGEYECVCTPEVTGMIVHEAFGHGVEMDMFVKKRALAEQYIGQYVASELVTMHDGAAAASQTSSYFFDDEGTLAGDTTIIDKGILKQGICDLLAAQALRAEPTGNGRRQSYQRKAYTRMTNTFFEGGHSTKEEMIASISYGFLLEEPASGMEDPKNWGIQCMVNNAREIRDGRLTGRIFSPIVLTGYVPDLLKSISMVSKKTSLSGGGFCGKGYKEWVKVSDGGPYIKARIRLG